MHLYEIRSKTENKVYIGSSIDASVRWKQHLYMLRKCEHHSSKLQYVYNRYGEDDLVHTVLSEHEGVTRDELYDLEKKLIRKVNCYYNGYNMMIGNHYNRIPSKLMKLCLKKEKGTLAFLSIMKEINNKYRGRVFSFQGDIAIGTLHLKGDSTLSRFFKLPTILECIFQGIEEIPEDNKEGKYKVNYVNYMRGGSAQVAEIPSKKGKINNFYKGSLSRDYYSYILSVLVEEMEYSPQGKYLITRMREEGILQDSDTARDWYNK